MAKKLYVGNLPYSTDDEELGKAFATYGVVSAKIICDRDTGRSRGFGFVEMGSEEEADKAITEWNGKTYGGRGLKVCEANPPAPRTAGSHFPNHSDATRSENGNHTRV